jgi:hypothetical protein
VSPDEAMTRLKGIPIGASDLEQFVHEKSDFAFEMRVVWALRELGFDCAHGGTYRDPVTQKVRQFDIRATRVDGHRLVLAVECKNLQPNAPLLLSAVPRAVSESFHHLLHVPPQSPFTRVQEVKGAQSFYPAGEPVGKQTDQVGRAANGLLVGDDQVTFEKISQAVNSCEELVRNYGNTTSSIVTAIVPVLVVPSERLWQVEYDANGSVQKSPRPLGRSTLFLDCSWQFGQKSIGFSEYRLSHLECVTFDELQSWTAKCFGDGGLFPRTQ